MKRLPVLIALTAVALALVAEPVRAVDLGAALRAALAADPSLASAIANRDAAIENIAIARSRLLPQISLQSTLQQTNQTTDRSGVVQDFSGVAKNNQLSLRQAIYRRRDLAGLDVGKLQAVYGEHKLVSAQSELWNRTALAWIDVLAAQALRDIYARTLDAVAQSAEQEKRRFEGGDGTRDAMAEASAQLAAARAQYAESQLDFDARVQAFNLITRLGLAGFEGFRLPAPGTVAMLSESEEKLLERILDTSPDVMMALVGEKIGEKRLAQSSADHWPTLDLVAGVNRAENDTANMLGTRYNNRQVGLQLMLPIYSGGGVSAAERQASSAYAAAKADREVLIQKLKTQFLTDWRSQSSMRERASAGNQLVAAAHEQRRAAEFGIKAGLRTWADMGAAELLGARRASDVVSMTANVLKVQARMLSLLPVSDPAWAQWTESLSRLARQ